MTVELQVHDVIAVGSMGEQRKMYRSRIEEVRQERLIIAWPTENGARIPIQKDERLQISIVRKGLIYGFDAAVVALELAPLALITIHPQGPPEFIERREDVRIPVRLPLTIGAKVVSISSYREAPRDGAVIRTHTLTLSAGGLTFTHNTSLAPGSPYDISLALPDDPVPLSLEATVVRSDPLPDEGRGRCYEIGLAYLRVSEHTRSRIVRYVFKAQASQPH
jgi:c-di-GMP-binding flagellar brake protein YcgR